MGRQAVILRRESWHLNAIRMEIELLRIHLALRAFNPTQPRVPAGRPEGGQWTSGDSDRSFFGDDDANLVLVSEHNDHRYEVDLIAEEGRGGHTVGRHIGKSDDELFARLEIMRVKTWLFTVGEKRNGSFFDIYDANKLVNDTLAANSSIVDSVASGAIDKAWVTKQFDFKTGREAYSTDDGVLYTRNTNLVGVRIIHDPNLKRGFYVRTAYPFTRGD